MRQPDEQFLEAFERYSDAAEAMKRWAEIVVRLGHTKTHGVIVRQIRLGRVVAYGVYVGEQPKGQ